MKNVGGKSRIHSGRATQKEVAARAGVSFITVSRVINNLDNVRPDTRERVLAAIRELDYHPNTFGRGLTGNRINTLGAVVNTTTTENIQKTGYYLGLFAGIEKACSAANNDFLISVHTHGNEARDWLRLFYERKADGLILIAPSLSDEAARRCVEEGVPTVIIGARCEAAPLPFVDSDNFGGMRDLTRRILAAGHRRFGFIRVDDSIHNGRDRLSGFRAALEEASVDEVTYFNGDFSFESGREAALSVLSMRSRLPRGEGPTVLVASNDQMGLGALKAFREAGLRVPEDISVTGFDGIEHIQYSHPPLTSCRQPLEEMGEYAAVSLLKALQDPDAGIVSRVFPVELIEGRSLAAERTN